MIKNKGSSSIAAVRASGGAMTFRIDKKGASANNNRSSKAGKYLFADQYENVVHNACRFYGCHMRFFYRRPNWFGGVLNHVRGFCESGFMRGKTFSTVNKNINEQEEKWYTEMYTDSAFANTASV